METPFVFGKLAEKAEFTDRDAELKRLVQNFEAGTNTILISPRRWGKSSLVQQSIRAASRKNKKLQFVTIDLFNVRSEEEFYRLLAQEVLRASASKFDELVENAKQFLGRFIPKLSYSPTPDSEFSLGLDWQEVKREPDDILNLPEKIGAKTKTKFVICIDEFQNIASFDDRLAFQKKLRANWQKQKHTSYCLYGSKRHMMLDVFTSQSMPFYKFGDVTMLEK